MSMRMRRARIEDAALFAAIKDQLPMPLSDESTGSGGFLLGTDEPTYREYIKSSHCIVAEQAGNVTGFAIILPDTELRRSDVWQKRHLATWHVALEEYESQELCYFEQFAFLPGHKRSAVALAYLAASLAFDSSATTLFATSVSKPTLNLAALPFIHAAGGLHAGNIDEHYPIFGDINSDIWLVEKATFKKRADHHPLSAFFKQQALSS